MTDKVSSKKRSWMMGRIKSKNTAPELQLRKFIFSMGFRYRVHYKKLPGSPDIVFLGRKKVIFVHGCFWHGHPNCKASKLPETHIEFWKNKISSNQERDINNVKKLENMGWKVLIVWQCELKEISNMTDKIRAFLAE
jgi:DNA mismatch endonuclease (patch repair protein)